MFRRNQELRLVSALDHSGIYYSYALIDSSVRTTFLYSYIHIFLREITAWTIV